MSIKENTRSFLGELVSVCPVLPYMALGVALSWAFIACSGTAWLSDTEVDGTNISTFFITVSIAAGVIMLAAAYFPKRVSEMLGRPAFVVGMSAVASLGCLIVIVIGPYYLFPYLPSALVLPLFLLGGIMSGMGLSVVYLKCAALYGALAPRRAILYVALAHLVVAITYFVIIGSPDWEPVEGGPSFMGLMAFICLPLAAGCLAAMSDAVSGTARLDERGPAEGVDLRGIGGGFWKMLVAVVVFAIVMTAVRAAVVETSSVDVTFNNTRLVMLLRMLVATSFLSAAVAARGEYFKFGKMFSCIMAVGVAVVAVLPSVGALHLIWSQVVAVVSVLFEILLWCVLSFIAYQKRLSPILVFGLIYGGYQLGSCIGWALGAYGFPVLVDLVFGPGFYLVLAIIVLICSLVLFSEKEFDELFRPADDGDASLEELLSAELKHGQAVEEHVDAKERFDRALSSIAEEYGLSNREADVFACLAVGYESSAISKKLQISWNTVRTHTRKVYAKLGVHSKQELIDLVETRLA